MIPIQQFSSGVLAEIIRRQPPSSERTALAWQIAVGPGIARTTTVDVVDGVLLVSARNSQWAREIGRASETILARMRHLLGAEAVTSLKIVSDR